MPFFLKGDQLIEVFSEDTWELNEKGSQHFSNFSVAFVFSQNLIFIFPSFVKDSCSQLPHDLIFLLFLISFQMLSET